jgi:hypothetical protein
MDRLKDYNDLLNRLFAANLTPNINLDTYDYDRCMELVFDTEENRAAAQQLLDPLDVIATDENIMWVNIQPEFPEPKHMIAARRLLFLCSYPAQSQASIEESLSDPQVFWTAVCLNPPLMLTAFKRGAGWIRFDRAVAVHTYEREFPDSKPIERNKPADS